MNRLSISAGSFILAFGLFGSAAMGEPQLYKQAPVKLSQLQNKSPINPKLYETRPNDTVKGAISSLGLNEKVRQYANSMMGKKVGDGECWSLVNEALKSAGAHQPGQGGYGSYVFGKAIGLNELKPGDILQFENVVFKHTNPNGSWSQNNFPHHTAIVNSVSGRQIGLIHQNINGNKTVQTGTINLDDKQSGGTLSAFRPQPK